MKIFFKSVLVLCLAFIVQACSQTKNTLVNVEDKTPTENFLENKNPKNPYYSKTDKKVLHVSNEEWKKILPDDLYAVAREADTERPFTGKYNDFDGLGEYHCAVCGNHLFRSDAKFSSTCGWPSFYQADKDGTKYETDTSYGMKRVEVLCKRCDSHLGHVFDDGPEPTGKRYCMNSISLDFEPDKK